jgi:hypothetical protein
MNPMAIIAAMNLILENLIIVDLIALPPAKWTHLATSKCLVKHILIEVAN